MSDPSIQALAKEDYRKSTTYERDWWKNASTEAKEAILNNIDHTDLNASYYETATEAYQKDLMATNYDTLPQTVKTAITEALIATGELPNPILRGVGLEYTSGSDVLLECDRCDESFTSNEDFDIHKSVDHGDEPENYKDSEEAFTLSMNPNITKEKLKEARKLLAEKESNQGVLSRDYYFNGKEIPTPTLEEPKSVGTVGYNDNPNEGLYDTKRFSIGHSTDRNDASVTESYATEGGYCNKCGIYSYTRSMKSHMEDRHPEVPRSQWKTLEYMGSDVGGDDRYVGDDIASKFHQNRPELEKAMGWGKKDDGWSNDWDRSGESVNYDESQTLSEVRQVRTEPKATTKINALENIDFSEEQVDFVYPTKASEAFNEEKDSFIDGYADDDIESESEEVNNQIIERKLNGYSAESIARELTIKYGISHEQAYEKVCGVEVSINDKIANTFFGKRYNQCNEAEKQELRMYSGSDE